MGELNLSNRLVMAPMTRNRATEHGLVSNIMVEHYKQRATAGLIITESTPISPQGVGYPFSPGLFTEEQLESWKPLIKAVHDAGGLIFVQLQHCGRISHTSIQPNNSMPVAPSAIKASGQAVTYTGMKNFETPRALESEEITSIAQQFFTSSRMAKDAGFDGIEIHGANGYIIDQFLRDGSNHRTDNYGGSSENRMRLLNEVLDLVCAIWSANKVGVRLSPENSFNSMEDSNPQKHFEYFIEKLSSRKLAYLHILEGDMLNDYNVVNYHTLRAKFFGTYIANNGYDSEKAEKAVSHGHADLIAFGTPFLANPDLVRRYRENLPLNEADQTTFYGGTKIGYNDYPFYSLVKK